MDEHDGQEQAPTRRALRRLRSVPTPYPGSGPVSPVDYPGCELRRAVLAEVGATDPPRVAALDALLKDVDDLRATMRRDLSLAATAVSAGDGRFAAFLLGQTDNDVRDFDSRSQANISELDAHELPVAVGADDLGPALPVRSRTRRLMPAAPLVAAAAALFMGLSGSLPTLGGSPSSTTNASVTRSLGELTQLARAGASPEMMGDASAQLHASMAPLILAAGTDPEAAQQAIDLLTREADVLSRSANGDHPELQHAIARARALVTLLKDAARRPKVPAAVIPLPVASPSSQSSPKPAPKSTATTKPASAKPSPTSSPSSKPSSSPSATPSSQPSSQPSPSASGEPDGPLDTPIS